MDSLYVGLRLRFKYSTILSCHFQRHEQNLALPSIEKAALECVKAGLETWEYKAKNALMYYPEGKYASVCEGVGLNLSRDTIFRCFSLRC